LVFLYLKVRSSFSGSKSWIGCRWLPVLDPTLASTEIKIRYPKRSKDPVRPVLKAQLEKPFLFRLSDVTEKCHMTKSIAVSCRWAYDDRKNG
jgi:hypothetical protein